MEDIYKDAFPDVFATFEDDYEAVKTDVSIMRLDDYVDSDK